ncbi:ADP-ribosylation factor-like protein [Trypanosoma equiperdum]|uniref:ADP-ribosylation factor-like protein n=1 Tax=Trypanosoma equiperdum TaxID=5694 RepID=A0A1G4IH30_TRYEQ|nr:ADP-ribosylation factor-like protein [Trypanosoma equiperdum]
MFFQRWRRCCFLSSCWSSYRKKLFFSRCSIFLHTFQPLRESKPNQDNDCESAQIDCQKNGAVIVILTSSGSGAAGEDVLPPNPPRMGLLEFLLKIRPFSRRTRRILMLGLDNAGKTRLLRRICEEEVSDTFPTQGFNIQNITADELKFVVWDVGGQKSLRSYWRHYFDHTDALVFVIDSADMERIEEARTELHYILEEEKLVGVPLLLFANKQDIPEAASQEEVMSSLNLRDTINRPWHIELCSAETGEGLSSGLSWVVDTLKKRRPSLRPDGQV